MEGMILLPRIYGGKSVTYGIADTLSIATAVTTGMAGDRMKAESAMHLSDAASVYGVNERRSLL